MSEERPVDLKFLAEQQQRILMSHRLSLHIHQRNRESRGPYHRADFT
jgi:hypothetical protein